MAGMSETIEMHQQDESIEPRAEETPTIQPMAVVEALLFSTDAPLKASRIAHVLGIGGAGDVKRAIDALNDRYEQSGSAFRINSIAGGFQMFTLPDYDPWLAKLQKARAETRLSQAAMEALAIVAYRQPIIRADIEAIRGVACGEVLVRLREMKLVKMVGRAEVVGRPMLYGTTPHFLEVFGLASLADLPKLEGEDRSGVPTLKMAEPGTDDAAPAGHDATES